MSADLHTLRTTCRACGAALPQPFLTLGPQPLANAFLRSPAEFSTEARYPLDLYHCPRCTLVQLADVIAPEALFGHYLYLSGTSDTITAHNARYAATVVELLHMDGDDLVVELASNNGSLLTCFREHGVKTLGVEPARNIAKHAREAGIETLSVFFDEATAEPMLASHGPARAVIANNVLAHVDDPGGFLRGARRLLATGGQVIFEVPYLGSLLDRLEYDTVYHEHLSYFSIRSLIELCSAADLAIARVDDVPVHGGSVRVYARGADAVNGHAPDVVGRVERERAAGMDGADRYRRFASDVATQREALRGLLASLRQTGATLAGYGAPAKGNTLLNYCGIDRETVPFTVDLSEIKVGLYTPGTHIPVRPVSTLLESQPDYVLILAWNFAPEIMAQQAEYAARGGRFIVPVPEPTVVSA